MTMDTVLQDCPGVKIFVPGTPVPQGSISGYATSTGSGPDKIYTGRVRMTPAHKGTHTWRDTVAKACLLDPDGPPDGPAVVHYPKHHPVTCTLEFVFPRLKTMPKRRTPPHTTRPDLDKLERAIFDALTQARIWVDDGQANAGYRSKRYAEPGETPGVHITLTTRQPIPARLDTETP